MQPRATHGLKLVNCSSSLKFFFLIDGKTKVKVIAGESLGAKAVIDTRTPIMFLDIHIQAGGSFVQDVPEQFDGFAYVWRGAGSFTDERISVEMGMVNKKKFAKVILSPSKKLFGRNEFGTFRPVGYTTKRVTYTQL